MERILEIKACLSRGEAKRTMKDMRARLAFTDLKIAPKPYLSDHWEISLPPTFRKVDTGQSITAEWFRPAVPGVDDGDSRSDDLKTD